MEGEDDERERKTGKDAKALKERAVSSLCNDHDISSTTIHNFLQLAIFGSSLLRTHIHREKYSTAPR